MTSSSSRQPYSSFTDGFYGFLSTEVDNLDRLFQSENSTMSINFLHQALSSLRSIHSEMSLLIGRLDLPAGEKWLDEYMDESTRLLAACRLFEKAVLDMARYHSVVDYTILFPIDHIPPEVHQAMRALRADNKAVVETRAPTLCLYFDPDINIKVVAEPMFNRYNGFRGALHAMKTVTTLLLAILLSELVYFSPETSYFSQGAYEETDSLRQDFRGFTVSLHRKVSRVISGSRAGILGLRRVESAVEELRVNSTDSDYVRTEIKRCVEELKDGADRIIDELLEFVDEIIEARKMVLSNPHSSSK